MISFLKQGFFCLALTLSCEGAVFVYDEAINGDISDDYLVPVVLTPGAGTSILRGTIADGDRDLFTLMIASGMTLNSIVLLSYSTDSENPDNVSYLMSQPGSILSAPPDNDFAEAVGYVGFGKWAEGREILRFLTTGPPYDYAAKLSTGSYAFWINETGPASNYAFSFTVSENAVPEPSFFLISSLAVFLPFYRKRSVIFSSRASSVG